MENINVTFEMIKEAEIALKDIVHHTQLQFSQTFSDIAKFNVFIKPENLQKTGSYKIRGAYNKLRTLTPEEKEKGVLTASAGNHAQGLALAAKMAGIKATVFMPKTAPMAKVEATKSYGAEIFNVGNNFDETTAEALQFQKESGALFISPFNDDFIIAGQGTIGLEILEECPNVKNIIVPIGGGGVIAGISIAVKKLNPDIKIIGVQAKGSPAMYKSFLAKKLTFVDKAETIADGINIKQPAQRTFDIINKYVDDVVVVEEDEISQAMLYLLERAKLVVEPSGAVGVAALISKKVSVQGDTVILVSGGNVDIKMLSNIIQEGLVKSGRYLKFITTISDSPGSLYKLLGLLYDLNASIININHDRLRNNLKLGDTGVEVSLETKNKVHNQKIIEELNKAGYIVQII
ncbi:MAG: threonine ammonia-lyase [Candidatus Sericytochromatia bacterium]